MPTQTQPTLLAFLSDTLPLRWGFEAWAAIGGIATCVVFATASVLCVVSFAFPPMSILPLGILLSCLVGLAFSMALALVLWITLAPLSWSFRCLVGKVATSRHRQPL